MRSWTFVSQDPEATHSAGRELGRAIGADGALLALIGPLGAGKTVFAKGLAEGLGLDPSSVSSPTFVIAQQYPVPEGPEWLHHLDLYRLESETELETIGFDDMLAPGGVLVVEWADRFPGVLGPDFLQIEFEGPSAAEEAGAGDGDKPGRTTQVTATGTHAAELGADWLDRLEAEATRSSAASVRVRPAATLGLAVLAGWAALSAGWDAVDSFGPLPEVCTRLESRETDALGTRRARCVTGGVSVPPQGVGRWAIGEKVDLASADASLLETLPGIGPVRAQAIAAEARVRPFDSIEALERVSGIGPVRRSQLASYLRAGDGAAEEVPDGGR